MEVTTWDGMSQPSDVDGWYLLMDEAIAVSFDRAMSIHHIVDTSMHCEVDTFVDRLVVVFQTTSYHVSSCNKLHLFLYYCASFYTYISDHCCFIHLY